jgi:molecular chaperone DnaK (HSP70)
MTPSYIAFTPEGEQLIGDAAKNQLISNPESKLSISLSFLSINHIYIFRYCF